MEPHSGGRVSGGYLYNQRIAASAPQIRRCPVGIDTLERDLEQLAPADSYSTVFDTALMTRVLGAWTFVSVADGLSREIAHARAVAAPDS